MPKSLYFLFNTPWEHEFESYAAKKVPSHRLFGYIELRTLGYVLKHCRRPKTFLINKFPILWRVHQAATALLSGADYIIATHESCALPALALKKILGLDNKIIVMNVALLKGANGAGSRHRLWCWALSSADAIVSFAQKQCEWIQKTFPVEPWKLHFVPFGVDINFFAPAGTDETSDSPTYFISAGTNEGKDFATLVDALPDQSKLLVVTDATNAQVVKEKPNSERVLLQSDVPIAELRELYRESQACIIPLKETPFSSGQTVMLENMALAKLVVITETSATRDYAKNGVNAITVPAGDPQWLKKIMLDVQADPARFAYIAQAARQEVEKKFSMQRFAERMAEIIESLG